MCWVLSKILEELFLLAVINFNTVVLLVLK
jgi:hypothetical protein